MNTVRSSALTPSVEVSSFTCIFVYIVDSHTIIICHMIIKFRIVENDAVHAVV